MCACGAISSKRQFPVEKVYFVGGPAHGTSTRIISTRNVWKKGKKGRRDKKQMLKNVRGNLCGGFAKKFLKQLRYKRSMIIKANSKDKNAAKKLLKKDLRGDSDFKENLFLPWMCWQSSMMKMSIVA